MSNKKKIINDPVYGFITIPCTSVYDVIQHPYFQRLRRIQQLGMGSFVYPSAVHTRFQHTLGALHLMGSALSTLSSKDIEITSNECEAASLAILMHDIGHGPFSHALERTLVHVHHETVSQLVMDALNKEMHGVLDEAIAIFKDQHPKAFLHQLVSGQLDVDRLDYLNRDSFFTGVAEGVIGYDRIIKMLTVHEGKLVVEAKGIYSIEKFIVSRRLMYWQVYLHKTVVAAEQMMVKTFERARWLSHQGVDVPAPAAMRYFLKRTGAPDVEHANEWLPLFMSLDDSDVYTALKQWQQHDDRVLSFLATGIVQRRLFKAAFSKQAFSEDELEVYRKRILKTFGWATKEDLEFLLVHDTSRNSAYNKQTEKIYILFKDGKLLDISEASDQLNISVLSEPVVKYYVCFPAGI
ncbi:MAG TPA: HD domain-containing protein [Chitinophagales bacterium]|nr:HD domain-containing protein [Chitinophagales bacterium]